MRMLGCLVTVVLTVGAVGCSGSDDDDGPPPDDTPAPRGAFLGLPAAPVQFRVVAASDQESASTDRLAEVDCTSPDPDPPPEQELLACQPAGGPDDLPEVRYLLEPAEIVGGVDDVQVADSQGQWVIELSLDDEGSDALATLSSRIAGTPTQVAVVVAGVVVSAPTFSTPIEDGRAQIAGDFTQDEASALAEAIASGG